MDVVLERDRDAVQRTAYAAGGALAIAFVRLVQGPGIDGDDRVQAILVERDAEQRLLDELPGGDSPRAIPSCMPPIVASTTVNGGCCAPRQIPNSATTRHTVGARICTA